MACRTVGLSTAAARVAGYPNHHSPPGVRPNGVELLAQLLRGIGLRSYALIMCNLRPGKLGGNVTLVTPSKTKGRRAYTSSPFSSQGEPRLGRPAQDWEHSTARNIRSEIVGLACKCCPSWELAGQARCCGLFFILAASSGRATCVITSSPFYDFAAPVVHFRLMSPLPQPSSTLSSSR